MYTNTCIKSFAKTSSCRYLYNIFNQVFRRENTVIEMVKMMGGQVAAKGVPLWYR